MHLTNYSINKNNANYVQNDDLASDGTGFKWSLSALCKHLEAIQLDMDLFWSRIYDVIIKAILSCENTLYTNFKKTCVQRNTCFELFGFDILIDSEFKPWLVEINLTPSLGCDSTLDMKIKSQLLADTLNLVGLKRFDRRAESQNKA
jgi:tubulin polyglutamylase TTLL5